MTARLFLLAPVAALLLTGCFGDAPPDPAVAPLEVVVESSKAPGQPCLLNRDEVAAGRHDVTVLAEGGAATVVLRDAGGRAVLEAAVPDDTAPSDTAPDGTAPDDTARDAAPPGERPPEGAVVGTSTSVQLEAGEYVVECATPAGPVGSAPLRVTPAGVG